MSSARQLKSKIKSVRNIEQITKAMQMVAATKMRRSQEVALNARPYAKESFALLLNLLRQAKKEDLTNVFLSSYYSNEGKETERSGSEKGKTAFVVVTSDKGLAGGFNSSVLRSAGRWKKEEEQKGKDIEIVAVGRKGKDFFTKQEATIAAEFSQFGDLLSFSDVRPLANWIIESFEKGRYQEVVFCSTKFVSALVHKVEIVKLLPLDIETLQKIVEGIVPKTGRHSEIAQGEGTASQRKEEKLYFILEPSRKIILEKLVKDLIAVAVTHLIFESNASEHSARMIAMKSATENASRLQEELTLKLNKARQAAITQELTEISTAKEALTND